MSRLIVMLALIFVMLPISEKETKPQLLYFGATWCGPCKTMKALFKDKDVKRQLDKFDMSIYDIDEDVEQARKYNIRSIPTMIFINDEGEIRRYTGSMSKIRLIQVLIEEFER